VATPSVPSTLALTIARRSGMILVGRAVERHARTCTGPTRDGRRAAAAAARGADDRRRGLSPKPERPSHSVARYLKGKGYRILRSIRAMRVFWGSRATDARGAARDHAIDVVDVFRRSELAGAVVDEAIALRPRLIWLQQGVVDAAAQARAQAAGIPFVMDQCLAVEHRALEV